MASSPIEPTRIRLLSEEIDHLFEHYLQLLHQYDTLRSSLSTVQASIQQNIARANFDAQRGVRYGQDCYDQRMQAVRRCCVTSSPEGPAVFVVSTVGKDRSAASEGMHKENAESEKPGIPAYVDGMKEEVDAEETAEGDKPKEDAEEKRADKPKDPIRMFGILTPQALRLAQGGGIKMVEDIVPKLVSIDAEMKEVEIKIRRARKHRAKAGALEKTTIEERREDGIAA
ncbi:hypothetical protein N431DRAFT_486513 [Stipitochalara longipes BDJ]|nr:hypothetical protein N431DRAFT_486513 [Stipitochalara longipes BDJ]